MQKNLHSVTQSAVMTDLITVYLISRDIVGHYDWHATIVLVIIVCLSAACPSVGALYGGHSRAYWA